MPKSSLVILGAGSPYRGVEPTALTKTVDGETLLDWLINLCDANNIKPVFVGGYDFQRILKHSKKLKMLENSRWKNTGSAYSLLGALDTISSASFVCYSDIIFRNKAIDQMAGLDADIVVGVDSRWRGRFLGRPGEDIENCEKVCLCGDLIVRLGSDIPTELANAEFVGLTYFSKNIIDSINKNNEKYRGVLEKSNLSDLLEILRIEGKEIKYVDLAGDWAELNFPEDIARFILGTKAQTLHRLRPLVKKSRIEDQVSFSTQDWYKDKFDILERVSAKLSGNVIVRSSAVSEDGFLQSNAGAYESILNVPNKCPELEFAIEKVIQSYKTRNPNDQVLIQPMLTNVSVSGVVFTRGLNNLSPYYFVNYDDVSGKTDTITSGGAGNFKTLVVRRDLEENKLFIPDSIKRLLGSVKELEGVLQCTGLDVEFAITEADVHLLQVRPITIKAGEAIGCSETYQIIEASKDVFAKLQNRSSSVVGNRTILGNMPDWNPAEIIGKHPKPLAISLYGKLITDEVWSKQRVEYGYHNVGFQQLVVSIAGQPYVDVRASFSSFVPSILPLEAKERLVEFCLAYLEDNPNLHDKVEFEVMPNCYSLDFDKWKLRFIENNVLSNIEVNILESGLREITQNAIKRVPEDLKKIQELETEFSMIIRSAKNEIQRAQKLLDDCIRLGTISFAHLARSGFVAVDMLRSAVDKGVISQDAYNEFMGSIRTVGHELLDDAYLVQQGKFSWTEFVKKYGHLRPGTYDIESDTYESDPDWYLSSLVRDAVKPVHKDTEEWDQCLPHFGQALRDIGIEVSDEGLEKFLYEAIEGREYSKFIFSRSLSASLESIKNWGSQHGVSCSDLNYCEIEEILNFSVQNATPDNIQSLISSSRTRRGEYLLNKTVELPALISKASDFDAFSLLDSQANFIGVNEITTESVEITGKDYSNPADLEGKIIFIPQADPGYDWLFGQKIAGLVTKYGGANSHMAIRAAEFGIPAAIGVGDALYDSSKMAKVLHLNPSQQLLKVIR